MKFKIGETQFEANFEGGLGCEYGFISKFHQSGATRSWIWSYEGGELILTEPGDQDLYDLHDADGEGIHDEDLFEALEWNGQDTPILEAILRREWPEAFLEEENEEEEAE